MAKRTMALALVGKDEASGTFDKVGGSVASLGKVIGGLAVAGVAAVGAIGAGLAKLAIDAAPLEGIAGAFEGITESIGVGTDEMLAALKKGSAGMITNRDLMLSFNKAAGLVSTDFATKLPEAMGYLGKVAAATGEDMGYMLDSLVTGVGRLSPMILDNLGIQVSLAEAVERASEMYGVEAKELTKAQQQAGMMNVVLEKLATNTAEMPDITENAATKMAALKATFQDTKDHIGLAFIPVLQSLMDTFVVLLPLVQPVLDWFMAFAPVITTVTDAVGVFVKGILGGADPIAALTVALYKFLPPEIAQPIINAVHSISEGIQDIITWATPFVEMAAAWIAENVELKDVLIALGIAIAAVVVPALISIIASAAPVIAAALALVAIVVLLRKAWESDFLGIRTYILDTLAKLSAWWTEHGDEVLAKATEIWTAVREWVTEALVVVQTKISEFIATVGAWWGKHGDEVMSKATKVWEAVVATFNWFKNIFVGIFDAFRLAFEGDWYGFGEKLREVWDEVWAMIKEIGGTAWSAIKTFFTDTDWGAIGKGILKGIAKGISDGIQLIKDAARKAAKAALEAAKGFLGIDSPSKVFMELGKFSAEGFAKGMQEETVVAGASAKMAYRATGLPQITFPQAAPRERSGRAIIINNYFGVDSVRSDRDIRRIAELQERSLRLHGVGAVA